jgi:hypothetical protein
MIAVCASSLLVLCSGSAQAGLTITGVGKYSPSGMLKGLSGITYAGDNQYYAVNDRLGLVSPLTIVMDATGKITSAQVGTDIQLTGGGEPDLEGIAYRAAGDDGLGSLYVSDETGPGIREYSKNGTRQLSTVTVPSVYQKHRGNLSLESLTISADGNVIWTANEEALTVDGAEASQGQSTTVRLQKFVRSGNDWNADGQFAYVTRPGRSDTVPPGYEASGVSDLCMLPNGQLLALERRFGGGRFSSFDNEIFLIDVMSATEVGNLESGLLGEMYTPVSKTLLWSSAYSPTDNFEGLCLGPQLTADTWSLLMVSDGADVLSGSLYSLRLQISAVPEPGSLLLMALGCGGIGFLALRRTKRREAL